MAKHKISLVIAIVMALMLFIVTMVFSALAAPGIYPFLLSTGNVSDEFNTEITPAGWTFAIWTVIYIFLALTLVFALSGFCRKNAYGFVYCSPAVLPRSFFLVWCFNMAFNTGWLFLWDRRLFTAALVFLVLIAVSNYMMIFFSCWGLHTYGPWLNKYHKVDLWLHRVLVQNGVAIYATWTTVASMVNLDIVLIYDTDMSQAEGSTISLSILTGVLIVWFILENTLLDKYVRFIVSIYPVMIWALAGVFAENYDAEEPSRNNIFVAALLAVACTLFVARVILVVWKSIKKPLYSDASPEAMSPTEIEENLNSFYK